jgi:hypothetical protein
MKYHYDWVWFMLATLWAVIEAYFAGLVFEGSCPLSIGLAMVTLSACNNLRYFFAFSESKEKIK